MLRRALAVGLSLGAMVLLLTSVALASLPAPNTTLSGTSKHKRYGVSVTMQCTNAGCKHSNSFAFQITTLHGKGNCGGNEAYQLAAPKIKGSSWTGGGQFIGADKRLLTFTASGKFKGKTVSGKIKGPKSCGGSDTFTAKVQPATSY